MGKVEEWKRLHGDFFEELKKKEWKNLHHEFLSILENKVGVYQAFWPNSEENSEGSKWLEAAFDISAWGYADWSTSEVIFQDTLENLQETHFIALFEAVLSIASPEAQVRVLWNDEAYPVLQMSLESALRIFDDIRTESWDAWIWDPKSNWAIESYHEGQITLGKSKKVKAQ